VVNCLGGKNSTEKVKMWEGENRPRGGIRGGGGDSIILDRGKMRRKGRTNTCIVTSGLWEKKKRYFTMNGDINCQALRKRRRKRGEKKFTYPGAKEGDNTLGGGGGVTLYTRRRG